MAYYEKPDLDILDDIQHDEVPDEALTDAMCWQRICEVQAHHPRDVDPDVWTELCRRRGRLRKRDA
jgi:hypothetical protein